MKKSLFLTAYDRIPYLQETLYSWSAVRDLQNWHFVAMIEPSPVQEQVKQEFEEFVLRTGLTDYDIRINPEVYGVLHHPWVGFEQQFSLGYDFVIRAEDDLIVTDDVLEFFNHAAYEFADEPTVATAHAFSGFQYGNPGDLRLLDEFCPWVWGTWRDRWKNLLGPTWDHNYSTFNEKPGHQAGWDWNINTRLFPEHDLRSVVPISSRSNNIGVQGVHGTDANFITIRDFEQHREPVNFFMGD